MAIAEKQNPQREEKQLCTQVKLVATVDPKEISAFEKKKSNKRRWSPYVLPTQWVSANCL